MGRKILTKPHTWCLTRCGKRVADGIYYLAVVYDDDALRNLVANILVHNGSVMGAAAQPKNDFSGLHRYLNKLINFRLPSVASSCSTLFAVVCTH